MKKVLLSVAGFDPTSGAGVTLDLKVFRKFGYYGMGIPTSLTAQNTRSVKKIHCPPPPFVAEQYRHLCADVALSGIKVGMIGCADNIGIVGEILSGHPNIPIVIDPVFRSSGGNWLLEKRAIPLYLSEITGKASLITPNMAEAGWITGYKVRGEEDMRAAAEKITGLTSIPCLVKGGHLSGQNIDILFDGRAFVRFKNRKLKKAVHGTGCFLSAAVLCHLAGGFPLEEAVSKGIEATRRAIEKAIRIGEGQHLFGDFP